jgi:predicted nucleic acid-binding protein
VIVVSDTSPINYLCRIGRIDILPALFGRVVIPVAVRNELGISAAPVPVQHFIAHPPVWLDILSPSVDDPALADLGTGERQAITLAQDLRADLLIADDMDARNAAIARQLTVIGTLGVVKLAAVKQLLDRSQTIRDLQAAGFYISEKLLQWLLEDDSR